MPTRTAPEVAPVPSTSDPRTRRFAPVARLIERLHAGSGAPVRVLDVGGFQAFWQGLPADLVARCDVTLFDAGLKKSPGDGPPDPRFGHTFGDVCDLSRYRTGAFDLVFSQGTLDHLGLFARQRAACGEIRRVGRHRAVRTPNRWFPVDPDYRVPGWQFLPVAVRAAVVRRTAVGWVERAPTHGSALEWVEETRYLTARELRILFPGDAIVRERLCGLTKSFLVLGGPAA